MKYGRNSSHEINPAPARKGKTHAALKASCAGAKAGCGSQPGASFFLENSLVYAYTLRYQSK